MHFTRDLPVYQQLMHDSFKVRIGGGCETGARDYYMFLCVFPNLSAIIQPIKTCRISNQS